MADQSAVAAFTDAIHYVLPKLLLTVTAFDRQASGDFIFSPVSTARDAAPIPYGIAQGTGKLALLDPADADAQVRALFEDIQDQHAHPGVASFYRGLGQYPAFLAQVWPEVRRHVDTGGYRQRKQTCWQKPRPSQLASWSALRQNRRTRRPMPCGTFWRYFATA